MKTIHIAASLVLLIFLGGCASEPFTRAPLPVLNDSNPQIVRDNFARHLPDRFTTEDAVIIHAPFLNSMAILCVVQVNQPAGTFEIVGLTQTGLEVFHFAGNQNGVMVRSAIPPLMAHKDILLAIARDIRRIYLDPMPTPAADVDITPTKLTFSQDDSPGVMVYEFGENPPVLLEKHLEGCLGPIWRVRYFDYAATDGTLYPRGIVMDNNQYHYRMVVKNRTRTADDK